MNVENCTEINKDDTIANQAELKKAQAKLKNLEACRQYYTNHKEYHKQYYAKNKESIQAK